jgi:HAD superfamily hydrolase (TIGR01493 family)
MLPAFPYNRRVSVTLGKRMEEFDSSAVKVILFDVYGTLVEIYDKRAPFSQLIQIGARQGRKPSDKDAGILMGQPVGLREAAERLGIRLADVDRERLERDLSAELASVAPFADTLPALHALKNRGFKLGLCSNLALDYAAPIVAVLPFSLDAYVWSFDTGAIKPDPIIYAHACRQLCCAPGDVLMVGDTVEADVEGPRAFGMQALLLDRQQRFGTRDALPSLSALCDMLKDPA